MLVPFVNPVTSVLLFLQSLFIYLHFASTSFSNDDYWGLYFLPTILAMLFLLANIGSKAFYQGRRRLLGSESHDEFEHPMSYIMFEILTIVGLLFTLVLYIFYLDEDTDLPMYWITTSFFVTSLLWAITLTMMYFQTRYLKVNGSNWTSLFIALLALLQGLFVWLYTSPWGRVFNAPVWVIALPIFIFLGASFWATLTQTYRKRNEDGPHLIRQFSFLFLILIVTYSVLAVCVYYADPDIGWVQPKWIALPVMIYTIVLFVVSIYVYWLTQKEKRKKTVLPTQNTSSYYEHTGHTYAVHQNDDFFGVGATAITSAYEYH